VELVLLDRVVDLVEEGIDVGVRSAPEFIFGVFCIPVGAYFKGGLTPHNFMTSDFDRAAPHGTGAAKVGGNYAASLMPGAQAKERHFADAIYLDPATHTKIEEVGAANFFAITKDGQKFITPKSPNILPSLPKYSPRHLSETPPGPDRRRGEMCYSSPGATTPEGAGAFSPGVAGPEGGARTAGTETGATGRGVGGVTGMRAIGGGAETYRGGAAG